MVVCLPLNIVREMVCINNANSDLGFMAYLLCEIFALMFTIGNCLTAYFCWNLTAKANQFKHLASLDANDYDCCSHQRKSTIVVRMEKTQRDVFLAELVNDKED